MNYASPATAAAIAFGLCSPAAGQDASKAATAPSKAPSVYEVQPGNTLEDFSDQLFGDKDYWRGIMGQNPAIKNPNKIYPGQKIRPIPKASTSAQPNRWRRPIPADRTPLLRSLERELSGVADDSWDIPLSPRQAPTQAQVQLQAQVQKGQQAVTSQTAGSSLKRPSQYPQFWLFPRDVRVVATMAPREDSTLYRVNKGKLELKRRGDITAKPFCLIRPIAEDAENDRRLYRVIARFFPYEAPLSQPFRLEGRHVESKVGDQLAASCPPTIRAIHSRYDDGAGTLAIPRAEVTVFHPEMRQFILPGQDAIWRLASGALPDTVRYLRLYRTDEGQQKKIEMARVEILQRSDRTLVVRYLALANTSF